MGRIRDKVDIHLLSTELAQVKKIMGRLTNKKWKHIGLMVMASAEIEIETFK